VHGERASHRLAELSAADGFPNEDKMGLHLVNLIRDRIGDIFLPYVHPHFEDENDERVLVIRCEKRPKSAFVNDGLCNAFTFVAPTQPWSCRAVH